MTYIYNNEEYGKWCEIIFYLIFLFKLFTFTGQRTKKHKLYTIFFIELNFFKGMIILMSKQDIIGNLTTIIKILIMTIAPAIAVYIGTDEQTVIAFLTAVLTFVLAVYDARYPNTMKVFDNQTEETAEDEVLNLEYTAPYEEAEDDK